VKVVVLTTSYPRDDRDAAGRFVADAVEHLRERGIEVEVVSPATVPHFGLAYGAGVVGNVRRRPWLALLLPLFLAAFARAARRAARDADVVHAHWLPVAAIALLTGKPVVVTLHGTDVELARRARVLARAVVKRVHVVIAVSNELAVEARRLRARDVRVIANGVEIPDEIGEESHPAEILFAGRLSPEKGVLDLVEAARGLRLVVAGDGPLRSSVPDALGWLSREQLAERYAHAAVVACPSHREGFGVACAEAMAHARAVVASDVGGLRDLVVDGETGIVVPAGNIPALRAALERLLADRPLRKLLGAAARARVSELCSWPAVTDATLRVYRDVQSRA
jgi:glycosyltransferase involved in cell wall biosynthesis